VVGGETGIGYQNQGDRASSVPDPHFKIGSSQTRSLHGSVFSQTHQRRDYTGKDGDVSSRKSLWLAVSYGAAPGGGGYAGCPSSHELSYLLSLRLPGELDPPPVEVGNQRTQGFFGIDKRGFGGILFGRRF
jgi:hypothetical protein